MKWYSTLEFNSIARIKWLFLAESMSRDGLSRIEVNSITSFCWGGLLFFVLFLPLRCLFCGSSSPSKGGENCCVVFFPFRCLFCGSSSLSNRGRKLLCCVPPPWSPLQRGRELLCCVLPPSLPFRGSSFPLRRGRKFVFSLVCWDFDSDK